jgi:hypothetical protein
MERGKREPQDYAAVCGLYWTGSAWYEVLDATCATQDQLEGELGNLCPVFACAGACRGEVEALRRRWPGVQLVVATPGDEAEYAAAAAALAADGWVPKPRLGLLLPQVLARLGKSLATAR